MDKTIWLAAVLILITAAPLSAEPLPVWIDTDPACGLGPTDDVDDCFALLLALKSGAVGIRGVSTVFGNVSEERAWPVAREFLKRFALSTGEPAPPVHRGARKPVGQGDGGNPEAVAAMARALEKEPLTIIALGPLTNVATLLSERPELRSRVRSLIAIAGSSGGERRFFFRNSGLLHFHDLNFLKDPKAFETVIETGIPMVLLPFEAAQKVTILPEDLALLAGAGAAESWLAEASQGWMTFWRSTLGEQGFYPFDSLAVGYAIDPGPFTCYPVAAQVKFRRGRIKPRDALVIKPAPQSGSRITYCRDVSPRFHTALVATLAGE